MQAVFISEAATVEQKPLPHVEPDLAQPELEVQVPDPALDLPPEEAPPIAAAIAPEPPVAIGEPLASVDLAVTRRTEPAYPAASRRASEEGMVMLRIRVDERGTPVEVRLEHSSGFERLDLAATEAVRKWRFSPAMRDGVATASYTVVRVRFRRDSA
jgi:periplasmic protein TonB